MKTLSVAEMQALDRKAIEVYGISGLLLMENAGRGVAEFIFNLCRSGRATILVGKGNNGGDGLVIARHLLNHGYQVLILLCADPEKFKEDPAVNFRIARNMRIPMVRVTDQTTRAELTGYLEVTDVVVDALFGIGLKKPLAGVERMVVETVNAVCRGRVVAVDIPSGLDGDSGEVLGAAIQATHTATLACPKKGLMTGQGPQYSGKIGVIHIGIPRQELGE